MIPMTPPPPSGSAPAARNCQPNRASNPSSPEPTIPTGVLGQVLLVVVLGVVEGMRGVRVEDLGGDRAVPGSGELLLVGRERGLGRLALLLVGGNDQRPVLGAHVVALAHALRGVVPLP